MATESPQSHFTGRLPVHQSPHHYQPLQNHVNLEGHAYGSIPTRPAPTTPDPYTRIAVLEKELEHCQTSKVEAEIALQCFAKLSAKGAANYGSGNQLVTKLQVELAQAQKEKVAFEAKLENALAIITTLLTSKTLPDNAFGSNRVQSELQPVRRGDHPGASKGKGNSTTSSNNTTIVEQLQDNLSDDGVEPQDRGCNKYQLAPQSVEFEDNPYIHHFVVDELDGPARGDPVFSKDSQLFTSKPRDMIHANSPSGGSSETSVEPNTDASSYEYATSSGGPTSTSSSFVTANSEPIDNDIAPAATVVEEEDKVHALGVQRWNAAASATSIEDIAIPGPVLEFEEKKWSKGQNQKSSVVKPLKGPFIAAPSWEVCGLFRSPSQRECAIKLHKHEVGSNERMFPDLFKYGVRFEPEQDENNIYRTVVIQGLSSDTTMHQLLQKVRGGLIVDAKLLETCSLLGSNSALIVFLHEHAAMAYEDHARTTMLKINDREVNVKVVNTPTYPISTGTQKTIEDYHHTRCLEVHNYPRQVSEAQLRIDIRAGIRGKFSRIEHLRLRSDGCLVLHFNSIDYAGQAFAVLSTFRIYRGCMVFFVRDPCAQPIESLKEDHETIPTSTIEQNGPSSPRPPIETAPFPLDHDQSSEHPHSPGSDDNGCDEASRLDINIRFESGDENFGRLEQIEDETKPEHRRGRGFQGEEGTIV